MATLTELGYKATACAIKRGKINSCLPIEKKLQRQRVAIYNELIELFEAKREVSPHIPAYMADVEEAADVVIAALTYLSLRGVDIDKVIEEKMSYNETREK